MPTPKAPLHRELKAPANYSRALNIEELRLLAHRRIPKFAMEYVEAGAEDEVTLRRNRAVFDDLQFVPRTLVDVTRRSMAIELFGRANASPLIIAPTGFNGMLTRGADIQLATAAAKAGIPSALSTVSNAMLEDVAAASLAHGGRPWFQAYMLKNRAVTENLVARALAANHEALLLTTDAAVFGNREWDQRSFGTPMQLSLRSKLNVLRHPGWLIDVMLSHGAPQFDNLAQFLAPEHRNARSGTRFVAEQMDQSISWRDVEWLRKLWPRKLLVKGVLNVGDTLRARDCGADAVVLTNHGARQLDGSVSAMQVLPDARRAVGAAFTLIIDSGFRRGTDVVKAIASGANAVMIGRATLYGVASGGEAGVSHALAILHAEIDRTLGQLGVNSFAEIEPGMLVRRGLPAD